MNTPRVVQLETKKAYRQLAKKNDVQSAIQALSNLKGIGPAFASGECSAPVLIFRFSLDGVGLVQMFTFLLTCFN
jgi:hypothetical protein